MRDSNPHAEALVSKTSVSTNYTNWALFYQDGVCQLLQINSLLLKRFAVPILSFYQEHMFVDLNHLDKFMRFVFILR